LILPLEDLHAIVAEIRILGCVWRSCDEGPIALAAVIRNFAPQALIFKNQRLAIPKSTTRTLEARGAGSRRQIDDDPETQAQQTDRRQRES
jgi:hypothetical protein